MKCLDRHTLEYLMLEKASGVSGFKLDACIKYYLDEHGRYPHLDEIPGVDSTPNLMENLEIKEVKGITHLQTKLLKELYGDSSIEEIIQSINDEYKDLEIDLTEIDEDTALIKIVKRPSEYGYIKQESAKTSTNKANVRHIIVKSLEKLRRLYGINFKEITNDELSSSEWSGKIPEATTANAFVYNGEIYINTDVISGQEEPKIHELMHIFLGGMRYSNPEIYYKVVQSMEQLPTIPTISEHYKNRTYQDILEEVFVTEYSKYLLGMDSVISKLPKEILSEIDYTIKRNLDSVLMGNYSVKSLNEQEITKGTLSGLSEKVESKLGITVTPAFINAATMHRRVANTKEELLKSKQLQEECK